LQVIFQKKINSFNRSIYPDTDKSISIRSFIIASISEGISRASNVLESTDVLQTIKVLKKLGVKIRKIKKGQYEIYGKGLGSFYCKKNTVLNFSNSGTAARLIQGCLSTNPDIKVKLTGDKSLSTRSMKELCKILQEFGAQYFPKNKFNFPLTLVSSELPVGIKYSAGISSQIKSAVILAGLNSFGKTNIIEKIKSRDHTEKMLKPNTNAIKMKKGKENLIEIKGKESLKPINISIPGDPSTASFYAALCLKSINSKIILRRVHINPSRIGFFNILKKHGGKINFKNKKYKNNEIIADVHVRSSKLKPFKILKKFYVTCVDEFPIIFCLASTIPGVSVIEVNSENLMNKESNRLLEMKKILKQIGIKCIIKKDRVKIFGKEKLNTQRKLINVSGVLDHRILMSSSILSLLTGVKSNLKNFEQVKSSCPNFLSTIKNLGGRFEIKKV
tara:strand:+ start:3536 stop:4873 length:1338 start_codon:yes stop_codon:yes gene_type:complete